MLQIENCCYVQRYSVPSYPTYVSAFLLFLSAIIYQLFIPPLQLIQTCWSSWCCKWWGDVLRIVSGRSTVFPSFGDELIMRGRIGDELTVERSLVFPEVLSPPSAGVPSWGKYVQSFWDYSIVKKIMCISLCNYFSLKNILRLIWHHVTWRTDRAKSFQESALLGCCLKISNLLFYISESWSCFQKRNYDISIHTMYSYYILCIYSWACQVHGVCQNTPFT